jgi:hypothetical protein
MLRSFQRTPTSLVNHANLAVSKCLSIQKLGYQHV